MANYTGPERTWTLDTAGIITQKPVWVVRAIMFPNAAGDAVTFNHWAMGDTPTQIKTNATTTVSGQTITSTGNLPTATINPGQIFLIDETSTGNNKNTAFLIATNADNNTITVDSAQDPTEEASKVYNWRVFEPRRAFKMVAAGTEKITEVLDFSGENRGKGRYFPNLAMDDLGTSVTVELHIG